MILCPNRPPESERVCSGICIQKFVFHTYDQESDEILYYRIPFNKCIHVNKINNFKNINNIFENGKILQLSCKIDRIDILKSRIMSNKLIY